MVNISLIDYNGVVENGISVTLILTINDETYDMLFWFNRAGQYNIVISDEFLENYNYKTKKDIEFLDEMIVYIFKNVLPPVENIFKEFNI